VAHVGGGMSSVASTLAAEPAARATVDVAEWARRCVAAADAVDERARGLTDQARPAELRALVQRGAQDAARGVAAADPALVVAARVGAMQVADYLATSCVEATVHALDLAAALDTA